MIEIYINDQPYEAEQDSKLLDVCKAHDIPVPTLCYHPALRGLLVVAYAWWNCAKGMVEVGDSL